MTRIRTVTDGTVDGPFSKYPDIITIPDDIFQSVGGGNGIFGSVCEYDYAGLSKVAITDYSPPSDRSRSSPIPRFRSLDVIGACPIDYDRSMRLPGY